MVLLTLLLAARQAVSCLEMAPRRANPRALLPSGAMPMKDRTEPKGTGHSMPERPGLHTLPAKPCAALCFDTNPLVFPMVREDSIGARGNGLNLQSVQADYCRVNV